LLSSPE